MYGVDPDPFVVVFFFVLCVEVYNLYLQKRVVDGFFRCDVVKALI